MAEFKRRSCQNLQRMSKATLLAMLVEDQKPRTYLESLPGDQWSIRSFDPKSRTVCITVFGRSVNNKFNEIETTLQVTLQLLAGDGIGDSVRDVTLRNLP